MAANQFSRSPAIPVTLLSVLAGLFAVDARAADQPGSPAPAPSPAKDGAGAAGARSIAVGDKVPDLTLKTLDGRSIALRELGRTNQDSRNNTSGVVMLTFWCSTCHSCRHIEKRLNEVAREQEGRAAVFALDASAGETASGVREFLARQGMTLPVLLDPSGQVLDVFGVDKTTTTLIIDARGVLRFRGRFADAETTFAENALRAAVAGKTIAVPTTELSGCPIHHPREASRPRAGKDTAAAAAAAAVNGRPHP